MHVMGGPKLAPLQGYNANGQLGDGTLVDKKVPTQVYGSALWKAVEVGAAFACGIQNTSRLFCWVRPHHAPGSMCM